MPDTNRYERILASHAQATHGLSAAMAEASRLARRSVRVADEREAALRDLTAGVVAPVLVGYVLWILQQARQSGIQRLYFVSRDGQILLAIARILADKLNFGCELRYFYGSRRSVLLPRLATAAAEALPELLRSYCSGSIRSSLARFDVRPEEVAGALASAGLGPHTWDVPLSPAQLERFRGVVAGDEVLSLMLRRAEEAHDLLVEYARQEGLLAEGTWGLVDSCGRGTMINSLANVVVRAGAEPPAAYYFNIKKGGVIEEHLGPRLAYFADARDNSGFVERVKESNHIEIACSGDHGMVLGYARDGERVVPVLSEERNQAALAAGLLLLRETTDSFTRNLVLEPAASDPASDVRAASAELMKALWSSPTYLEALAWGANLSPEKETVLVKPFGWRSLPMNLLRTLLLPRARPRNGAYWVDGSLVISPLPVRALLKAGVRVARTTRKVTRWFSAGAGRLRVRHATHEIV